MSLTFVHRSAYQYLADSSGLSSDKLPLILKPQRLKQLHRGVTAVWYFIECADSAKQLEGLKDPLMLGDFFGSDKMAYGLWLMAYGMPSPRTICRHISHKKWRKSKICRGCSRTSYNLANS